MVPLQFAVGYELTKYGANEVAGVTTGGTNLPGDGRELDKDGHLVFIGGNYDLPSGAALRRGSVLTRDSSLHLDLT